MMTFKKGFLIGIGIGLLLLIIGALFLKNLKHKTEQLSQLDVQSMEYRNLDNQIVDLKDIAKGKHVLVNFWATWCKPCLAEFPLMDETSHLSKDEFVFIVVSDESTEKIKSFIKKNDYNFVYLKTSSLVANGINPIPQSFVLDNTLKTRKHHLGVFDGSATAVVDSLRMWVR